MGMSTAFSWTLPPLQFMETFRLGAPASPPDSLHAPSYPTPISTFSWDSSYQPLPSPATHRMWLPMDLPLLCNVYSVLFAKYERLRGGGCWGGSCSWPRPGPPAWAWRHSTTATGSPGAPTPQPSQEASWNLPLLDCLWPQADMKVMPLTWALQTARPISQLGKLSQSKPAADPGLLLDPAHLWRG